MPVAWSHGLGDAVRVDDGRSLLAAVAGVAGALCVGLLLAALSHSSLGDLSRHMAAHILLMNVAAPLASLVLIWRGMVHTSSPSALVSATVLQIVLLWGWHSPVGLAAAHGSPALLVIAQASLIVSALWFWLAVLTQVKAARWSAIAALLLTGKLFCLLGALLTFAPRPLFSQHAHVSVQDAWQGAALADQQLAGLLMLAACPATYVVAGVLIAARWLNELLTEAQ